MRRRTGTAGRGLLSAHALSTPNPIAATTPYFPRAGAAARATAAMPARSRSVVVMAAATGLGRPPAGRSTTGTICVPFFGAVFALDVVRPIRAHGHSHSWVGLASHQWLPPPPSVPRERGAAETANSTQGLKRHEPTNCPENPRPSALELVADIASDAPKSRQQTPLVHERPELNEALSHVLCGLFPGLPGDICGLPISGKNTCTRPTPPTSRSSMSPRRLANRMVTASA